MSLVDDTARDVGYAVRVFRSHPVFTVVAVVTLALGIGANTAIFSVVHGVLLRPLPYADADRLVRLVEDIPAGESVTGQPQRVASMAIDEFVAWRMHARTLSHMALYASSSMTLMGAEGRAHDLPIRLRAARMSAAAFPMLGLRPIIGRVFGTAEETRGADAVVVLSAAAWTRHFASDPAIVGRTITLDERVYTVIGVLGPSSGPGPGASRRAETAESAFPEPDTDLWMPFAPLDPQTGRMVRAPLIARLQDGVSRQAAAQEANAIARQLRGGGSPRSMSTSTSTSSRAARPNAVDLADAVERARFDVVPVQEHLVAPVRTALFVLMLAVSGVLMIACANVANLLLARSVSRQREIAIRGALGARRSRLARQLLTESLVLASIGSAAGLALAFAGVHILETLASVEGPRWLASRVGVGAAAGGGAGAGSILPSVDRITIDGPVLAFTLSAACLTGLLFGLAPVLRLRHASHSDLINQTTTSHTSSGRSGRSGRSRSLLVIAQLALATMLLVAAGLLIRSFVKLSSVDPGYDPEHVVTFQVVLPPRRVAADNPHRQFVAEEITGRIRALPGVQSAGFTNLMPLTSARWQLTINIPGVSPEVMRQSGPRGGPPQTRYVSQAYLQAMGVRLIEGRWFSEKDDTGGPNVLLVNEALARRFFPGASPVKTMVSLNGEPWEIAGVIGDVRQGSLDEEAEPQWFIDFRQLPSNTPFFPLEGGVFFAVRANDDARHAPHAPDALSTTVNAIRGLVRQIEPQAALDNVYEMEQLVSSSLARPRFYAVLLGIFAGVAAVLATVGIYGVLAYSVTQRTREIGIRMALGAPRWQVLGLVMRQSAVLIAIGIAAGVGGALALTRYLTSMLFGLTPVDPATFMIVSTTLAAVAAMASYVPARRATSIDPTIALRSE